jgi:hypothetical protein
MRSRTVTVVGVLLGLCLLASAVGGLAYLLWPREVARPVVLINSPSYGEQVQVGETVAVHATARDRSKVTRVELWVDGQLHEAQTSALPGGISPFPLAAHWQALHPGTHRLTARAFNAQGARAHASINLEVLAEADQDGDGVFDGVDACLDERGWRASAGCPDRDYDGIPDAEDACPDEAGLPDGDGCPTPSEHDGDGDGVLDDIDSCPAEAGAPVAEGCPDADGDRVADAGDACPTEPGWQENDGCPTPGDLDFDGVPNEEDDCAEEWGLPEHSGCSDDDGDGVPDRDDACLDEPGLPEHGGCADRDGDGVPDPDDLRPDEPGPPEGHGGPDTGAPDSDGDGVPDDIDECDHEEGLPEHVGCPPPGEEGAVATVATLFSLVPFLSEVVPLVPKEPVPVEFQALEFRVGQSYQGIRCYVHAGNLDPLHEGPFDPLGEMQWNIADYAGSVPTAFEETGHFPVYVECNGYQPGIRCDDGTCIEESIPFELGFFRGGYPDPDDPESIGYPIDEWDGHVITGTSERGDPDHWFEVKFRICTPSCEEVVFQPPVIELVDTGPVMLLAWRWDGERSSIDGFYGYVNGNYAFRANRSLDNRLVQEWEPACGEASEFQLTVRADDRESPRSNTEVWQGEPCPRTVRVEFYSLETGDLGDDEWNHDDVGPIHGHFRANSGDTEQRLDFDAVDPGSWWGEETTGYRLDHNREYLIRDVFDWIWRRMNCMGDGCPNYYVAAHNYITVELGPYDDLTFGGTIFDHDDNNSDDRLFDADYTIPLADIYSGTSGYCLVPGYCEIQDRNITLTVIVSTIGWETTYTFP